MESMVSVKVSESSDWKVLLRLVMLREKKGRLSSLGWVFAVRSRSEAMRMRLGRSAVWLKPAMVVASSGVGVALWGRVRDWRRVSGSEAKMQRLP